MSQSKPVTYTNRKGTTLYLCRAVGKTGKPRYYFAREPRGEVVEQIPAGFKIDESDTGLAFLVKDRPALILPAEVAAVEAELKRHPQPGHYRVKVKPDRIEIHERMGPDAEELLSIFGRALGVPSDTAQQVQARLDRTARFEPVLRFILLDAERRTFSVERWCYLGSIDDWLDIGRMGPLDELTGQTIPTLGTDQFFELW
ncbi:MAG: hypothetical protein HY331_09260 [Chloroflexi bacterium]|nr:hypothetical protein [Chloroflexota bacterium]